MKLTSVTVRNFRCIKELTVDLDQLTVLVGENNTGKTAFLEAIRICLERLRGRSRAVFHEYDYHLGSEDATPASADPIEIELFFREPEPETWPEAIIQEMSTVLALKDDRYQLTFRLTSSFDAAAGDFVLDWSFLDADGNELTGAAKNATHLTSLQRVCPAFYLSALRDAAEHFAARGRYWRAFLSESTIQDKDRRELEKEFAALNQRLLGVHQPLADVRKHLETAKNVIDFGAGDAVAIDALPTKLFALLARTQVSLASRVGAKIPVDRQGEGTQSLAVLLLFDAFLRSKLSLLDDEAEPITALEEPEAHLHPCAIRALMGMVRDLRGQTLVSTHSGDLLAAVNPMAVRRFVYRDGAIRVFRIAPGTLDDEELRKFDFHVRRSRGELLFARCWLLGEGESEGILLAGAAEALGIDLERAGVRCVEYSQTDVGMLAKVANQLGIAWYCVADDDSGRKKYEKKIKEQLNGVPEADRIVFPYKNVERFLCDTGFGGIYETRMSAQKTHPSSAKGTTAYWDEVIKALPNGYSKPAAVLDAVLEMKANPARVPQALRDVLGKAVALAGG
ncbi:MAG: ATP-dependent nuclease [Acidobacteriota bacterium]